MVRPSSALGAVLFAALAVGCGKKVSECNALVKQLNESSTAMEAANRKILEDPKQSKQTLEAYASTTKAEADKIAKVELSVPELVAFAKTYQGILGDTIIAANAIAKTTGDAEGIEAEVTKARDAFMGASQKLGEACVKGARECKKLGDTVMKMPTLTGEKPAEDAQKLEDYAKGIAPSGIAHADVKAAVEAIKKTSGDFASSIRKFGTAKDEDEKARKALMEAGAKETPLVKSINDFCQGG